MNRRTLFQAATAATLQAATAAISLAQSSHTGLEELTLDEIHRRKLSAQTLTQFYLRRIEALNPRLRAVIEVNPDALHIARKLDAEGTRRSVLHGIPVLLKDNIDTGDRMQTTAGSLALVGAPKPKDAPLVQRLRDAGAVILGKTNLSEWANFRGEHSTSGWSGRGGLTHNPYALDRNPCGSSSGSAVAVTSNLCAIAVGTETDGSIVCPSSMNGIVGIKPTVGLISSSGVIPISSSQDTAGPMARTVRDAALALGVLAGRDYSEACHPDGLRGMRIGIARQYMEHGYGVEDLIEARLASLRKAGAIVIDPVEIATFHKLGDSELTVMQYEFKAGLNAYLAGRGGRIKTLADCIAFNRTHASEELTYFGQELMEQSQEKGPLTEKVYREAVAQCRRMRSEGIDATLGKHKLDAIMATTAGPAPMTDLVNGDHIEGDTPSPAAIAGYPHITVPAGDVWGLPIGMSFFGAGNSEAKLIRIAYGFEQATKARRQPRFLQTIELKRANSGTKADASRGDQYGE